jgi:hypothetical protein
MMKENISTTRSNHFIQFLPFASGRSNGPSYNLGEYDPATIPLIVDFLCCQLRYLHVMDGVRSLFLNHLCLLMNNLS